MIDKSRFKAMLIEDSTLWDRFVDASPSSTLFHRWDFLRIVEKHTGYKLFTYGIFMDDRLQCIFPFFCRRGLGLKVAYSAPPAASLPYLGFITGLSYDATCRAENEPLLYEIAREIDACISAHSANYTYIQTVPEVLDSRPFQQNGFYTEIGLDYYIDLSPSIDELWDNFSKTCKRDIRQQEKAGLKIRESNDVDTFYDMMRDRFTSLGLTTYFHRDHRAYLREALSAFPDHIKMLFLCRQGKVESAGIFPMYHGRYFHWMGIGSGRYNDYFMWELLKSAKCMGMVQFKNPGADSRRLTSFKSKFNPSLEPVYAFTKIDPIGMLAQNFLSLVKRMRSMKAAILGKALSGPN